MPAAIDTRDELPPLTRLAGSLRDVPVAATLEIPNKRVVSVEHPCIIRNLDKALQSMGGEPRMKHVSGPASSIAALLTSPPQMLDYRVGDSLVNPSKPRPEPEVGVSLRPDDPYAVKLTSTGVETRNVLLKITLPRRTGRKRKRGTDDAFEHHDSTTASTSITAPDLLRRLRDNENDYVIEPVSMVRETHRFRNLPDFQIKAGDVPIYQELNAHVLRPRWSDLKDFHLDTTVGLPIMPSFPGPPSFAATGQPYRYEYQQAAGVRFQRDEAGNVSSLNMQAGIRKLVLPVAPDIKQVPTGPPANLTAHSPSGAVLPRIIDDLKRLLDERPLVTTRVALNLLPHCGDSAYREATQWVGYSFKAGPFRDTLIKYGVDPRKDPKYRIYQTLMFQLDKRASRASGDTAGRWNRSIRHAANPQDLEKRSHIFDGEHVSLNGKTWQVCDISDPLIKRILDTQDLADQCDPYSFGWYHDGTVSKARVIMREKMTALFEGKEVEQDLYELVAKMPDRIDEFPVDRTPAWFGNSILAGKANALAGDVRGMAKGGMKGHHNRLKRAQEREALVLGGAMKDDEGENDDAGAGETTPAPEVS